MHPFRVLFTFLCALGATAIPGRHDESPLPPLPRAQVSSVTNLTASQLSALAPYTQFARAAYCWPSKLQDWKCGQACDAVPDFQVSLADGDGDTIQYYYVGYWPSSKTVVVAHQGTDPVQFWSLLTDANVSQENLNSTLFPGVDSSVQVHEGFANEHTKTAPAILDQVNTLLSQHGATSVTLVGHSLGGALAELDCMYMALNLPSSISIKGVTYGTPRVGNTAWAELFDSKISDFQRINNKQDPIPIVPSSSFENYTHPQGEVHIVQENYAVECPGDEDTTDPQCTIMSKPDFFHILDHLGPYQGIDIGTLSCDASQGGSQGNGAHTQDSIPTIVYHLLAWFVIWMGGQY